MKKVSIVMGMALLGMGMSNEVKAEEPASTVKLEVGADLVSSYIWRGQDCAGFSVQPAATLSFEKAGLSLGAWASVELMAENAWANMSEFDLALAWSKGGLTVGLTDYNFCGDTYFSGWKFNCEASHNLEANLAYDFGKVALAWNTVLTGPDHRINDKGEVVRNYSTYVEASAPWKIGDIEGSAAIGASLWDDAFTAAGTEGFKVCNIALTATKEIFSLPFSASVIANPQKDKVFFVVGVSF